MKMPILIVVALLAGCTSPQAAPDEAQPSVTMELEGYLGGSLEAKIRNTSNQVLTVDSSGFRLVDEDGVVRAQSGHCLGLHTCFPRFLDLRPGEAAQGSIGFGSLPDYTGSHDAYQLIYEYNGVQAQELLRYPLGPKQDAQQAGATLDQWIRGDFVDLKLTSYHLQEEEWTWNISVIRHDWSAPVSIVLRFPWEAEVPAQAGFHHATSQRYEPFPGVSVKAQVVRGEGANAQQSPTDYSWAWD